MTKINPEILLWARETAGLTLEEASKVLGIREVRNETPVERLISLETGGTEPSRAMLLKMEKKYRRPLIVFYMKHPPRKGNRGKDFRTLPENYTDVTTGLIDALIRNVKARQGIMRSALEDEEEVVPLTFINSMRISDGVDALVESIREELNMDLDKYRDYPSPGMAFKSLRSKVESVGVFVLLLGDLGSYHTAFDLEVFRGFALSDDIAPFVVINDQDSQAAWSFTLIHELVHLWLGQTGISSTESDLAIEKFCNMVASEFLLPEVSLETVGLGNNFNFEDRKQTISDFAFSNNLSSSMVAYKLYLQGEIDQATWVKLNIEYRKLFFEAKNYKREKMRGKKSGPSYYVIRRHRLGDNLISLVQQMVLGGTLTTQKASKVLGVAPKNLQNLMGPVTHTQVKTS